MNDLFLLLPVLLVSIVVHEVAHAWQARREGDDTAASQGRITLNPLPHIDLVGSVLVPLLLWFGHAGILFGWAKPVPVVPANFRDYKWGDIRVSLAGIVSNMGLAVLFTLVMLATLKAGSFVEAGGEWSQGLDAARRMAYYGLYINLILAFFNLVPIPPLDGSHVVYHMLPGRLADEYRRLGRFGLFILMGLVFLVPSAFSLLLWPVDRAMGLADSFIRLWI
jgi:Zn-dependent protease